MTGATTLALLPTMAAGPVEMGHPEWLAGRWRHTGPLGLVKFRLDLGQDGSSHFQMRTVGKLQEDRSSWRYEDGKLLFGDAKKPLVWKIRPATDRSRFTWNPDE